MVPLEACAGIQFLTSEGETTLLPMLLAEAPLLLPPLLLLLLPLAPAVAVVVGEGGGGERGACPLPPKAVELAAEGAEEEEGEEWGAVVDVDVNFGAAPIAEWDEFESPEVG